jgi:hypothetical protein
MRDEDEDEDDGLEEDENDSEDRKAAKRLVREMNQIRQKRGH